jgi:urea transport system substrate-binding protein
MRLTSALAIVGAATAATIWLLGEMLSGGNPNLSQHANRPSASGPPIRVGILSSLSGSLKAQGVPISEAVKLAIGELNHDGGVLGRTLDAFSADGHSDPEHFKMEAQRLIAEEQVVAIFGCWSSPARKAVKTVVEDHDNLLLYPAAHEGLESSAHITYFGATPNQSMLPAVKWAYAELEARRFLLVGTDSLYSKAASAIIRDAVKKMGGKLVGEVSIAPTSADMSKLTPILDRKKPDVILNTLIGASNAALFAALSDRADADAPRVISFNITERDLTSMSIKRLQGHYLAGTYFQLIERGTNMDFLKKFRTKYGSERIVTPAMAAAYVSVYMWAEAVTQAKSAKPEDVRPALLGLTFDAPGGKTTIDAKTGHRSNYARIIRIEPKGQLKLVYASVEALAPEPFPSSRKESAWRTFVERLHTDWANQWAAPRSP